MHTEMVMPSTGKDGCPLQEKKDVLFSLDNNLVKQYILTSAPSPDPDDSGGIGGRMCIKITCLVTYSI